LILSLGGSRVVGMYLRTTQRRNKDGSVVRYVQLAHNRRVEGVTQAEVLLNLGREDGLDRDGRPGWSPRSTGTSANPPRPRCPPTSRRWPATGFG
jgi:hypothetical protein